MSAARPLQSLPLRQAIIERLRADADLIAIVNDRVYERSPAVLTWPFVRYGSPDEAPVRRGTWVRFAVHTFSKTQYTDETAAMNAAVQASLENATIDLGAGLTAYAVWIGSQVLADPAEANAHHGVNVFEATIG